jgi:hypothetical protein
MTLYDQSVAKVKILQAHSEEEAEFPRVRVVVGKKTERPAAQARSVKDK